MSGQIYVSKVSGVVQMPDGGLITLQRGVTRVREGHALLDGRAELFEEIDVHYEVEQATARPGEVRVVPAEDAPPPRRGPGRPRKNPEA